MRTGLMLIFIFRATVVVSVSLLLLVVKVIVPVKFGVNLLIGVVNTI